jgi:mediator of RNA polymerase II transcription subunit 10
MNEEEKVDEKVTEVINTLLKTGLSISKCSPETMTRIETVIEKLSALSSLQTQIQVPINVIQAVDGGVNPLVLEKNQMNALVDKNQKTKGRIESLRAFRAELANLIKSNYPELIE